MHCAPRPLAGARVVRRRCSRVWFAVTGSGLWPPLVQPRVPAVAGDRSPKRSCELAATGYQGTRLLHHFLISLMRFGIAFAICVADRRAGEAC